MEFIQNAGEGTRLDRLNIAAVKKSKSVLAAIAYVTDTRTLIDECSKHETPLTLYARYDYSGPVAHQVLEWFLSKSSQSANYEMRLIPDIFHPKVIWWKGVGVYIGSANLTKSAWFGNVEAGVYLDEEELDDNEMRIPLQDFFEQVRKLSKPLTKEIAEEMVKASTGPLGNAQVTAENTFNKTRILPIQPSLVSITKQPASAKSRALFLNEWSETLQYLRDIGQRLSQSGNNPDWVPPQVPFGVLADQFLHAYYYNRVQDGQSYPYRELFETNKQDREAALSSAIDWWKNLKSPPSNEHVHITKWAPEAKHLLATQSLKAMSQSQFANLCQRIHAVREHAKRMKSTTLGLEQGMIHLPQEERIRRFGEWLYTQRSPDKSSPCEIIDYVLHGGSKADVSQRLFEACFGEEKKIPHLGVSSLGEMVGWAMPDDFPPRNGRTSKALTALGYTVKIHSE